MKETRYNLRLTKSEKESLNAAAKQSGVSIITYIKQKLFTNNCDIAEEGASYESPSKSKHEYFNTLVLQTVYMLLLDMLCENRTTEEICKPSVKLHNFP